MRSSASSRSALLAIFRASATSARTGLSTASKTSSWYSRKTGNSATGLAATSASSLCARHSSRMAGLAASRPLATTSSVGATAPPATRPYVCSVASASTIMIATSPSGSARPATTMSNVARASSSCVGKATHWPSTCATRVAPTGPEYGRPESFVDIEAALIATTSYGWDGSSASTVSTIWTSLRRPLAKLGRSGRSMRRQVRIASSLGRPSRRKNEPGMRPAAYIRSSTSTVSGKKSNCSFGCLL